MTIFPNILFYNAKRLKPEKVTQIVAKLGRPYDKGKIKVDFDLTMSITAHNLYRLFAKELERYGSYSDQSIYQKYSNFGNKKIIFIGASST